MCGVGPSPRRPSTLRSRPGSVPVAFPIVTTDRREGEGAGSGACRPAGPAAYPGAVPEPDAVLTAPPATRPVRWGLPDAAIGWLVGLVGGAIAGTIVLAASGADDFDSLSLGWVAVAQLGLWLGLLGAPYLAARFKGNGMRRDFGLTATWSDAVVGGLAGVVGQFAIFWLVYLPMSLLTDVTPDEFSEPAQNMADKAGGAVGVILLVLIVGIGAPIVEEIFYRGLLQRSLVRRVGVPWGIAVSSMLFGAAHFQWLQFPALALAGALFGVLAHRAGRLGPAIAAHIVFNMTAVVTLLATS
jgi:membrane protease YdiL (CAAX protease family)